MVKTRSMLNNEEIEIASTDETAVNITDTQQPQPPIPPGSTRPSVASRRRRIDLARARAELAKKEVELAAAKVLLLEVESEDEIEEIENENRSNKIEVFKTSEERTKAWVKNCNSSAPVGKGDANHTDETALGLRRVPEPGQPPAASPGQGGAGVAVTGRLGPTHTPTRQAFTSEIAELAAAITTAARPQRTLPELPFFGGISSDWLPFKAVYEETSAQLSEQENVARLRRSLKGAAREAAQCLFVGTPTASEVMKLLTSRFGRPDALIMSEIEKLRSLPRLTEHPRDVCVYASKVANITATINALKKPQYLYNPEVVRGIVEKFPSTLRYRYYDFAAYRDEDEPDLMKLTRFLEHTADRCGSFAPAELMRTEDRREQRTIDRKPQRAYHTEEAPPTSTSTSSPRQTTTTTTTSPHTMTCEVCGKDGHRADRCEEMKEATVPARWDLARKHRLCFRCLKIRRYKHTCKPVKCGINGCTYTHHALLHGDSAPTGKKTYSADEPVGAIVASARERTAAALLKILPIKVQGPKGDIDTYALLDDGSTCTLIDEEIANKIGAEGPQEPFYIEGVAGARIDAGKSHRVHFTISGQNSSRHNITARTMTDLHLSSQTVSADTIRRCTHLRDIEDSLTYERGTPTVLIGQDNWHLLLSKKVRRGRRNQPVASLTHLGWVLHGTKQAQQGQLHRVNHIATHHDTGEDEMEKMMREHFAMETLGVEPRRSYNEGERRALAILQDTTRRLPAGGFETGLLWKSDDPSPPDNYESALRRLASIEHKLDKNEELKKRYATQMRVLIENNYAELAPTTRPQRAWYLPHFAVINPAKPEKLRIVHDAAARTKGISLNDMLLSGPDMLQSLPGVLMRYRQRPVAVTADIKDMFMRVTMREEDRDMQRFLWRDERRDGAPMEYRMKSVIFGATSSPCTAIYVKNRNAEEFKDRYPEAATAVVSNHYMDDYLASYNSEEEAIKIANQVAYIHSRANFFLQRWTSNSKRVRAELAPGHIIKKVLLDPEKILGMMWDPERDTLSFNVNHHKIPDDILHGERTPTKREALRTAMSIYDPLGVATPVTIQAKRILQETWRSGIGWDEELSHTEARAWAEWVKNVAHLQEIAIPRCYPRLVDAQTNEIHTFVDASSSAYAAAVYWRSTLPDGTIHTTLIMGKGRVAPLKTISIPRLELQAAVLGCRLTQTAIEEHDIKPTRRVYWSDSKTVLTWIRNGPREYKPYVAHRIAEIAEVTKTNEWRWVPTKDNVADDATRDTPRDFDSRHRWFRGPKFLRYMEETWPQEDENSYEDIEEERVHATIEKQEEKSEQMALPDINKLANWMRVIRVTARVLQFIDLLRSKQKCAVTRQRNKKNRENDPAWTNVRTDSGTARTRNTGQSAHRKYIPIEAQHLLRAQKIWIRVQQREVFAEEIALAKRGAPFPRSSRLAALSIEIDNDGILRLRSRVAAAADITTEQANPPVIDGNHKWTRMYIAWVHSRLHHGGFETTANEVRQHYWILRLRYAVRTVVKQCQFCRVRRARPATPSTGNHPIGRVAHHQRPFTYTGLDLFGPLTVTVGRTRQKRYGVLFTCLTTRAVHLELAGSLTTDSAVMALRRFLARRGCPTEIWSDQGTNLRGADLELRKAADAEMQHEASVHFVKWCFIPPSAPFMGGAWERLVRSVKTALQATLRERAPKEEILATLLVEAEHTINSRPLTHVSMSPDDQEALTPNHFLMGGPSRVPHPGAFDNEDLAGKKEWRTSQRLADIFWSRWVREYLPEMQRRREPRARGEIKPHDLVLIADGTLPRNCWPRGIVEAAYPGPDGEVRVVDVRTRKGTLRRPTKKLVILPTKPDIE